MRRTILLLLFFAVFGALQAQMLKSDVGIQKKLKDLSEAEINAVFDKANPQLKVLALQEMALKMKTTLNGTILIALDNKVVVRKSYGYARLYKKGKDLYGMTQIQLMAAKEMAENRITSQTPFELASVSKQFTAVAILKLASQGKLDLKDYLTKYYPENPYPGITIHHLLSHTSGLPEYFNFPSECWGKTGLVTNEEAIAKIFARHERVMFKPGARYKYVNTNYLLLAGIVAKVTGMKFEKYMADSIFNPVGMNNTFYVTEKASHKDIFFPRGHLSSGEEVAFEPLDGTFGDKGLYSCADALLKWKIALFDDYAVIPKEWLDKAVVPQNRLSSGANPPELYGYGFHIEVDKYHGKIIYHGGLWHGFHHIMGYRPSDNLFFVCLSNCRNRAHVGKLNNILSIMDGV